MSNLLSQASLVMIPSGYKEDVVYSQIPTNGNGDLSFTRASNGTRVNSAGLVEVCPWNMLSNSEEFTTGNGWFANATGGASATFTANYGTAPNGTTTADRIQLALNAGPYADWVVVPTLPIVVGQTYTYSIYMKALSGTPNLIFFGIGGGVGNRDATITGEWVRYSTTFTALATDVYPRFLIQGGTSTSADLLAWGAQLNIGSTAKPYFPTTDRLNVPRLTYQNGGGGCPSLLLEKQSTNLITYSEDFSNGSYGKSNGIAIATNTTTSPDGTINADKVYTNTTVNGDHYLNRSPFASVSSSTAYTYSIFAKKGEFNYISIEATIQNDLYKGATINLNDGSVSNNTFSVTPQVENYGNGWYRISVFGTTSSSQTSADTYIILLNNTQQRFYTGDGVSGIYTYGWQLEASSYPTSYIPTTSSSATRVADVCSKTSISSLIGQSEGVLFCDFNITEVEPDTNYLMVANISDGTTSNRLGFARVPSGGIHIYVVVSGASQFTFNTTQTTGRFKLAITYKANDYAVYLNGTSIYTNTSASVPSSMSRFDLGNLLGIFISKVTINEAVLFKTRLTNAELASLTTI